MKNFVVISIKFLFNFILKLKSHTFAYIQYTKVCDTKKNSPYGTVTRTVKQTILIGTNYRKRVESEILKKMISENLTRLQVIEKYNVKFDENYVAAAINNFLGESYKSKKLMLRYEVFENSKNTTYIYKDTNGNIIDYKDIEPYLYSGDKIGHEYKKPKLVNFKQIYLHNIEYISILGCKFKIENPTN